MAVYEVVGEEFHVIDYFHTAQDWERKLVEGKAKVAAEHADYYSGTAKDRETQSITTASGLSVFVALELHAIFYNRKKFNRPIQSTDGLKGRLPRRCKWRSIQGFKS